MTHHLAVKEMETSSELEGEETVLAVAETFWELEAEERV